MSVAIVILAAGQSTRMKSDLAKVLHPVGGKPMVLRTVATAEQLQPEAQRSTLVVGRNAEAVRALIGDRVNYVTQEPLLGTGHAVQQAEPVLRGQADMVVVFYADMPLIGAETLHSLIAAQRHNAGPITLLTLIQDDPHGFGRIIRGSDGRVLDIVEERECTPEQLLIRELNASVWAFRADWLWDNLPKLKPHVKGELYLTDLVAIAVNSGLPVSGLKATDNDELIGINTRIHLAEAEAILHRRIAQRWMLNGVTIIDPATAYIDEDVMIGQDTIIHPNTHLHGKTIIGTHCEIGPNSIIQDSTIGSVCNVKFSVVEKATLENHVNIGPFAHLRSGAYLSEGVHMGNFGEVKNSRLGAGTRMGHFSYLGDAEIGADVNIGAGTITVNYDGVDKHKTIVGDHAFIGSDSMLIAPLTISANARTAAGAVVTRDVPEGQIAIGVPARLRPITGKQNEDSR